MNEKLEEENRRLRRQLGEARALVSMLHRSMRELSLQLEEVANALKEKER